MNESISEFATSIEAKVIAQLPSGHAGAQLFVVEKTDNSRWVVKLGATDRAQAEIHFNGVGYRGLNNHGFGALLPEPITEVKVGDKPALLMRWAGNETWAERDRRAPFSKEEIEHFLGSWSRAVTEHAVPWNDEQGKPAEEALATWYRHLADRGLLPPEAVDDCARFSIIISLHRAGILVLDFTPDNVIVGDAGAFTFIDPWEQPGYLGNPAISLGQFVTLAADIYKLPSAEILRASAYRCILDVLAPAFGRDICVECLMSGYRVGAALQHALSAFVLMDTDAARAREHAEQSWVYLKGVVKF